MELANTYAADAYAAAYAQLEFPGTYFLAFRDLPDLIARHVTGRRALDFGCGTGRSTRFLAQLGFQTTGVDIAAEMVARAQATDPRGDYRLVPDGTLGDLAPEFDLAFAAYPFDNIPTAERKIALFSELAGVLKPAGRILNLVSTPEIYWHEWVSFSTRDFPENRRAKCGDEVRIINTALADRRPCVDILWPDADYRAVYRACGLEVLEARRPLGRPDEPYQWVNEQTVAPWVIYVLGKAK